MERAQKIQQTIKNKMVMAILNLSPNSFSGDGITSDEALITKIHSLLASRVNCIDVGAQSTKPGSPQIEEAKECEMVANVVSKIRSISKEVIISVDTTRASVAALGIQHGADIINDISGGEFDQGVYGHIKANPHVFYIFGHVSGNFNSMHKKYLYDDIVTEIINNAQEKIKALGRYGISIDRLMFDPGIGFSKGKEENLAILNHMGMITKAILVPVCVGLSRKRFIRTLANDDNIDSLDSYTLALNMLMVKEGTKVIRTHEVRNTMRMMTIIKHLTLSI